MSYQVTENQNTRRPRKAGRTLLVKPRNNDELEESWLTSLTGLQSHTRTQSNSYFLNFDTKDNSLEALKSLKSNHSDALQVKFAYYKTFFVLNGLTNESDYNDVKERHINFVESNTGSNVLYYKLYRNKNMEFLGCGTLTMDTKEGLDALLDSERFKEFSLDDTLSGTFRRYNRRANGNVEE